MSKKGPSEAQIKEKWDRCIEGAVVRSSVGTVLGGLASLILFRRPVGRAVGLGLGAGFGLGMSYSECRYEFEHPNLCHHKRVPKTAEAVPATVADTMVASSAAVVAATTAAAVADAVGADRVAEVISVEQTPDVVISVAEPEQPEQESQVSE